MAETTNASVTNSGIEMNSYKPGRANAMITGIDVAVWAIIAYWQGGNDLKKVAADYELSEEQLLAAFNYYAAHKAVIDARIEANEAA